ncbi:ThiF family adenylyltransferase, partial [Bacillus sp. D-CC]
RNEFNLEEIKKRLQRSVDVKATPYLVHITLLFLFVLQMLNSDMYVISHKINTFLFSVYSQKYNIPWIYGGCVGSYGVTYTIVPGKTPCFRCLMEHPASGATCDTAGIIQPAVQLVVAHQITEALKILVEDYGALRETMLSFDLWNNQQMAFKVNRQKKDTCLSCGRLRTYPSLTFEGQTKTEVLCGRNTVQ